MRAYPVEEQGGEEQVGLVAMPLSLVKRLEETAQRRGTTMASLLRDGIERVLEPQET